jgi:hypothetical protein
MCSNVMIRTVSFILIILVNSIRTKSELNRSHRSVEPRLGGFGLLIVDGVRIEINLLVCRSPIIREPR